MKGSASLDGDGFEASERLDSSACLLQTVGILVL